MGNRRNVITLNGNRYDAVTGELLNPPKTKSHEIKPSAVNTSGTDGFVSKPKVKTSIKRQTQNISRTPHKSKTLVRRVVSKPAPTTSQNKVSNPQIKKTFSDQTIREQRSKLVTKSSLISKFGQSGKANIAKYSTPLPVSSPPKDNPSTTNNEQTAKRTNLESNNNKSSGVLENAIRNSQSHKNSKLKKTTKTHKLAKKLKVKPSFLNISLFALAGLLMAGYFAYNNVPNLAMRIASTRSGINGNVPGYQAGGFSFNGPIEYQVGQITLKYKSNSDDRSYVITQKKSEWNSDTLLSNHVAVNGRSYQLLQEKGKTIYIYDSDNASWIENGVWYEIKGQTSLSADQVIKIANSL